MRENPKVGRVEFADGLILETRWYFVKGGFHSTLGELGPRWVNRSPKVSWLNR